jgi:hypothetical protein
MLIENRLRTPLGMSSCDQRRYTIVELEELAKSDELQHVLDAAGAPPAQGTGQRRKWSELTGFDRSAFDYGAYLDSLKAYRASAGENSA